MMKKRHSIPLIVLLLLAAVIFAPWKMLLEKEIRSRMAAAGLPPVEFSISSAGFSGITFENVSLVRPPLTIASLTIDYSAMELLRGEVREVHVPTIAIVQPGVAISLQDVTIAFDQPRAGSWSAKTITATSDVMPLPPLSADGRFSLAPEFQAEGNVADAQSRYRLQFAANPAAFSVRQFHMPWKGGVVSTSGVDVPLTGGKTRIPLHLAHVPLDSLLQLMVGEKAQATGAVSGTVPVVLDVATGDFTIEKGRLAAEEAGEIRLAPEAIPGGNQQVAQVRELMQDFRYDVLTISTDLDKADKLSMLLSLSGHNPQAYNGREVKLNVKLTGDLLSVLTQSIMPMVKPETWLEYDKTNPR